MLSFDFDDLPGPEKAKALAPGLLRLRNAGSEPFQVHVATLAGGTLLSVPDPDGGRALRFPPYRTREPRGAVVVTASTSSVTDPLAPGTSAFTFGGDFTLDARSEGGGSDDGNNLIQRGLSDDPAQYKIQIEARRVSCVVAGEAGQVVVKAKRLIVPGTWYHVSCTRDGDQVILQLGAVGASQEPSIEVGATGAVYVTAETPLVIGGKATASGVVIVSDSDQFNGLVDNVFLEIGEES